MHDLIRDVGAATGQDRQLDAVVFGALHGWVFDHESDGFFHFSGGRRVAAFNVPAYTSSLDAVLSIWPNRPSAIPAEPRLALAAALQARIDVCAAPAGQGTAGCICKEPAAMDPSNPRKGIDMMDVLAWIGGGAIFGPTVIAVLSILLTGSGEAVTPPMQIAGGAAGIALGFILMMSEKRRRDRISEREGCRAGI
jgi:hypothetical protein